MDCDAPQLWPQQGAYSTWVTLLRIKVTIAVLDHIDVVLEECTSYYTLLNTHTSQNEYTSKVYLLAV